MVFDRFKEKLSDIGIGSHADSLVIPSDSNVVSRTSDKVGMGKSRTAEVISKSDKVLRTLLYPVLVELADNGRADDHEVGERPFCYIINETEDTLVLGGAGNVYATLGEILGFSGTEINAVKTAHKISATKNGYREHTMMDEVVFVPKPLDEEPEIDPEEVEDVTEKIETDESAESGKTETSPREKIDEEHESEVVESEEEEEDEEEDQDQESPEKRTKTADYNKGGHVKNTIDEIFEGSESPDSDDIRVSSVDTSSLTESDDSEEEELGDEFDVVVEEGRYASRVPSTIHREITNLGGEGEVELGLDLRVRDDHPEFVVRSFADGTLTSVIRGGWIEIPPVIGGALDLDERQIDWKIDNGEIIGEIVGQKQRGFDEVTELTKTSVREKGGYVETEIQTYLPTAHSNFLDLDDGDRVSLFLVTDGNSFRVVVKSTEEESPNSVEVENHGAVTKQISFVFPDEIVSVIRFEGDESLRWGIGEDELVGEVLN